MRRKGRQNRRARFTMLIENTALAFESLRSRPGRSVLTTMGVFIGVVIIIAVASALNGFRQRIVDRFEDIGSNTIYISRMPFIMTSRPSADVRRREYLTLRDAQSIEANCSAVDAISAMRGTPPFQTIKYKGEEVVGAPVRGAMSGVGEVINMDVAKGRFFTEEESRSGARVCVIGHEINEALFFNQSAIEKKIQVNSRRFRVIGIMEKATDAPIGDNVDDQVVYVPYNVFGEMFPWERKEVFIIARAKTGRMQEAIGQIEEILRARRRVGWHDENDFEIGTSQSIIEAFDQVVFAAVAVMIALSAVAFLVGGVGVTNVMFASVKERTREIGVRRAVGARRRDIIWQFLTEASAMTGTGGLLGVLIGESVMFLVGQAIPALPVATPMWARLFGFFGSMMIGLIFGLWPAITAARLDPITALRYE